MNIFYVWTINENDYNNISGKEHLLKEKDAALKFFYDTGISETVLEKLLNIIKKTNFNVGMYWGFFCV